MDKNYLVVKITRNHIRKIFFKDVLYIKADGNYSEIYLTNTKKIVVTRILKTFEFLSNNKKFYRINKSYIINSNYAIELIKGKINYIIMINEQTIPIHKKYYASFVKNAFLL